MEGNSTDSYCCEFSACPGQNPKFGWGRTTTTRDATTTAATATAWHVPATTEATTGPHAPTAINYQTNIPQTSIQYQRNGRYEEKKIVNVETSVCSMFFRKRM